MKVLHLVSSSLPKISGYSIRTHNILKFQNKAINAFALTDLNAYYKSPYEIIDNVIYFQYPKDIGYKILSRSKFLNRRVVKKLYYRFNTLLLKRQIALLRRLVKRYNIDLIHAHSVIDFGKIGLKVAREFQIPFIFEIRGFMEYTYVALRTFEKNSRNFYKIQRKRTKLAKNSDLIITLGKNMKKELMRLNSSNKKIKIIPNGIDTSKLKPIPTNNNLKDKLGLNGKLVLGYIGSIRPIEGIEILIKSIKILNEEGYKLNLLLVGKTLKSYFHKLANLSESLKILDQIKYVGPVSHEIIKNYYSIVDIIIIPRLDKKVNRIVTPLKPLEAMSMEKLVLTSKLPALCELVKPKISGDLFEPNNVEALADKIKYYINNSNEIIQIGRSARKYVIENFDWKKITEKYLRIYENLL